MIEKHLTFAAYSKKRKIVFNSSSGGVFFALATYVLKVLNGTVFGCVIHEQLVFHKRVTAESDLQALMKSKYVQSDLKNTFKECKDDLLNNRHVLYVGTPCQIFSLKKYLKNENIDINNLITVDFVCHGTPSKKYWESYYFETFGNKKVDFDFRYNRPTWTNYSVKIFDGKNQSVERNIDNNYMRAFLHDYILLESCYDCRFKGGVSGSDFTLADFWGGDTYYPELFSKRGTSIVVVKNKKDILLAALSDDYFFEEIDFVMAFRFNNSYFDSTKKPIDKEKFDMCFANNGFLCASKTYASFHNQSKESNHIKQLLKPFKVFFGKRFPKKIKKRTIGIITDYGFYNFGNRLQNYALRKTISKYGVNTINLALHRHSSNRLLFAVSRCHENIQLKSNKAYFDKIRQIKKASLKSGDKTLFFAYDVFGKKQLSELSGILIGSDQVWNWTYHKSDLPFMLGFFGYEYKRPLFSYAASIGTNSIDEPNKRLFSSQLSNFKYVGVRENGARDLLKEIGIESMVNVDPTLLMTRDEWDSSIKLYSKISTPSKYCLKYILGSKNENNCNDYPFETIDISDKTSNYYAINHFDFISLIKNSSIVITDSFHAFVFSLIYKKKIILIPREEMQSRFDAICKIIGIEYVYNKEIDLSKCNDGQLDKIKNESIKYLEKCLALIQ